MMSVRIHVGSSSQDYNNHNRCMYLQYSLWPKRESFCADDFCPLQTWEGFTLPFMMHATDCSTSESEKFIGPTSIYNSNTRIQCSANLSLLKIAHAVQWLMPPNHHHPIQCLTRPRRQFHGRRQSAIKSNGAFSSWCGLKSPWHCKICSCTHRLLSSNEQEPCLQLQMTW